MNTDPLRRYGENMQKYIRQRLKEMVSGNMYDLQGEIRRNRFVPYDGQYHDNVLMRRSGHLSNSIRPTSVVRSGDEFTGGLQMGKSYGRPLIGKRGTVTDVYPKTKKYLAIPLPAALGNHGVVRGRPLDKSVWGDTFIRTSKAGNLIIFGKQLFVKGKKQGQAKTGVIPLFILKKHVQVRVKIAVEELYKYALTGVGKDFEKLKNDLGLSNA